MAAGVRNAGVGGVIEQLFGGGVDGREGGGVVGLDELAVDEESFLVPHRRHVDNLILVI